MRNTMVAPEPVAELPTSRSGSSVVPAIDEFVAQFTGRGLVAGAEVVDILLDLRLIAVADEVVGTLV